MNDVVKWRGGFSLGPICLLVIVHKLHRRPNYRSGWSLWVSMTSGEAGKA